jgi:peptidylprolyl isomerase
VALVAACSGSPGTSAEPGAIYGVGVTGSLGAEPTVRMAAPLTLHKTQAQVVITGTGPPVQIDQLFVLELTLYDARTGARAASTYDQGQQPLLTKSTADSLFPALVTALVGKRQGSRVVVALSGADGFGSGGTPPKGVQAGDPLIVIADILAVPPAATIPNATGTPAAATPGAPTVTVVAGDPTEISVPRLQQPPARVVVIPLIDGHGPKVRDHSLVTIDYLGQVWGSGGPFADTYFKEPVVVPIGAQLSLPAWNQALVGVRRGSRLLVIDPNDATRVPGAVAVPSRGTIAWVIDILGVS